MATIATIAVENEQDDACHTSEAEEEKTSLTLKEFMDRYHESISKSITEKYRPLYQPTEDTLKLPKVLRPPLGRQELTIRGVVKSLAEHLGTIVVGEMGTGKTYIAITAARMAGFKRVLIMCPPHLVQKWKREVEETLGQSEAHAAIVESVTDMQKLAASSEDDGRTLFVIMSREKAKLSHSWKTQVNWKLPISRGRMQEQSVYYGEEQDRPDARTWLKTIERWPVCPKCGQRLEDDEGIPYRAYEILNSKKKLVCLNKVPDKKNQPNGTRRCNTKLWGACRTESATRNRIGLTEYARKKMPNFFDLFVADEVHEYKAKMTAQGLAAADGTTLAGKSLVLTGTLMGGYSSTLFYLLFRFRPEFRHIFNFNSLNEWIRQYGFYEYTVKFDDSHGISSHGSRSRRVKETRRPPKEKPGLMPGALFHLIESSAFLRLNDVSSDLPRYDEHVITVPMDTEVDDTGYSQRSAYNHLYQKMYQAMMEALADGSQRLMGAYLQTMLAYPDAVVKGETAIDHQKEKIIADIPPLDAAKIYPKEQELVNLVRKEQQRGRRVLVYVNHTERRDITGRIKAVLDHAGIKATVMKSGSPEANKREKWIETRVKEGLEVLICNPKLVQTGLDLIQFPTIVWYETEYSVYTMRQASRRSWRIGQKSPVDVYYMTYQNCLQADALKLVAQKVQSSLAVEGDLPEDGLSAYGDSKENLFVTLARQIAGQMPKDDTSPEELEHAFRRARDKDVSDEQHLVDQDEWKLPESPQPEPEPAPVPARPKATSADEPAEPPADRIGKNGQMTMFSMSDFISK